MTAAIYDFKAIAKAAHLVTESGPQCPATAGETVDYSHIQMMGEHGVLLGDPWVEPAPRWEDLIGVLPSNQWGPSAVQPNQTVAKAYTDAFFDAWNNWTPPRATRSAF